MILKGVYLPDTKRPDTNLLEQNGHPTNQNQLLVLPLCTTKVEERNKNYLK